MQFFKRTVKERTLKIIAKEEQKKSVKNRKKKKFIVACLFDVKTDSKIQKELFSTKTIANFLRNH